MWFITATDRGPDFYACFYLYFILEIIYLFLLNLDQIFEPRHTSNSTFIVKGCKEKNNTPT